MQSYPQRVWDNIIPLSVGETLPEAFEEWAFTEETQDHEKATERCELCEQEDLRYHFRIKNQLTGHQLWVGSQCILRFSVSVFEHGRKLSSEDAKKKLNRVLQKLRQDACMVALERVAAAEKNDILFNALRYFKENKHLSPKFAFVVLWRLRINKIEHSPSFFKVTLKHAKHQADLNAMEISRVHVIWPALTTAQREMAVRMGHRQPTTSVL